MGEGPWGSGGRLPAPPPPLPSLVSVPLALTFSSSAHFLLPDYFFSLLSSPVHQASRVFPPRRLLCPLLSRFRGCSFFLETRPDGTMRPAQPLLQPLPELLPSVSPILRSWKRNAGPPSCLARPMRPPQTTGLPPNAPQRRTPPGATPGSVPFISFPAGSCTPGIPLPGHPRSFPLSTPNPPRDKKSPPAGAEVAEEPGQAGQRK